ncbi:MAG: indolepyruvate oxidoreductase subunit beta [Coriobacteriales bacterium]|jgi:indolepyruvate ferredoxin oxidoreductase beta subunit|nr:indolepyruvate oxidoreductase subunit beta [Coriobacteriales bacterium]
MSTPSLDIVVAGVGGQGTVLASKLLAQAALIESLSVRTAETIGMAQRGGSVLGHVRIRADLPAASPLVPLNAADLLIGFEPAETVRALPYLREGGTVVTAHKPVEPVSATLGDAAYDGTAEVAYLRSCEGAGRIGRLVLVDGDALCEKLGSTKVLNVVLIGAALKAQNRESARETYEQAIESLVKPRFRALNKQALAEGMSA